MEEHGKAGGNRSGGTSRTPSPTGRLRRHNARGNPPPGGGETPPLQGVGGPWWGRRWTKERVVEDADPYGGWETGRVPRFYGVRITTREMVKTPPEWAAFSLDFCGRRAARKGGIPSCASLAQGASARCGARPGAQPLDPACFFVKKRGKKLLLGETFARQAYGVHASKSAFLWVRPKKWGWNRRVR